MIYSSFAIRYGGLYDWFNWFCRARLNGSPELTPEKSPELAPGFNSIYFEVKSFFCNIDNSDLEINTGLIFLFSTD